MNPEPTHRTDETDIGSGEKSKGQHETEKMISQVTDQNTQRKPEHGGLAQPTGPAQPGDDKH
jgi:hypothetical protein